MSQPWEAIPIETKLFNNVDEKVLPRGTLALENAYINDVGGHSRFPGLTPFAQLPDRGRVFVGAPWRGDLIVGTSTGRIYRVAQDASFKEVTGTNVEGGNRIIFAPAEDRIVMAAGGPIVQFAGDKTSLLSESAPLSSHVGYIDSYIVASEVGSGRFHYCDPGAPDVWQPLSTQAADSKPDDISALIVTPYRELLVTGKDSIEQWERLLQGDVPFFRRWAVGEGVKAPYTVVCADNAAWCVNRDNEFVRFSGQQAAPESSDIANVLDAVDDWTDAWVGGHPDRPLAISGQRFIVLQAPNATNAYGTKGLTLVLDYRQKRWLTLYGWDSKRAVPVRWPGWSHYPIGQEKNQKVLVGGESGMIYVLDPMRFDHAGQVQRVVGRTAHMSEQGEICIDAMRARFKRGVGDNVTDPIVRFHCNRDNGKWSRWIERSLGKAGDGFFYVYLPAFGNGHSFMFEWECTDACDFQLVKLEAQITKLGF